MADAVTDTRSDLLSMLLTGGVTGPLTGMVIDGLAGGMADIRVDISTKVCVAVVGIMTIILDGVVPLSYAADTWSGTTFDTEASIVVRVDVVVDILIDLLTRTATGVVPDIGDTADLDANTCVAVIAVLKLIILPASLEDLLLFRWMTFSCWPITVLGCRALQA